MALIDKLINIADTIRNMTDSTDNLTLDDMNTRLNECNLQMKLYCYKSGSDEYYVDIDCYNGHPQNNKNYYVVFGKDDSGLLSFSNSGVGTLGSNGIITYNGLSLVKDPNKTAMMYTYFSE